MGEIRDRIAANIKFYRKRAGLSVDAVGKALGKSGKTISAWEVGRGQPDADDTILLCRVLGIEIFDLYGEHTDVVEGFNELTEIYEKLDDVGRKLLLVVARGIAEEF